MGEKQVEGRMCLTLVCARRKTQNRERTEVSDEVVKDDIIEK